MPNLGWLLLKIPDEFKPAAAIGIGALMMVILVLFHGFGLHHILVQFKRTELRLQMGRPHPTTAGVLFGWSVFLMLSLHIIEITAWAFGLIWLGLILRPNDAIYFCANAYTTLGYGTVDLDSHWRNISPIIAISGLFTFAWTTSSLVSVVANHIRLVGQLEEERLQQLNRRAAARRAAADVLSKEKEMEGAARLDASQRAAGASFFERRRIKKAEKQREQEMRESARAEMNNIHHNERSAEDTLGHTDPPDNSGAKK